MDGMNKDWPAWRYGPNGQQRIFDEGETVPAGWKKHPDELTGTKGEPKEVGLIPPSPSDGSAPKSEADPVAGGQGSTADLDAGGWPFDANMHASTQTKTKDGYWRMKVGVARPEPKPGYPVVLDL